MKKILLATQGTGGDLYPFIEIACALKARGHSAVLITSKLFEAQVRKYDLDFVAIESSGDFERLQSSAPSQSAFTFIGGLSLYSTIKKFCESGEFTLVSHCNLNLINQTIAEKLRLPYVIIYTAPYFAMRTPVVLQMLKAETETINRYRAKIELPPVHDWRAWITAERLRIGLWPEWFALNDPSWLIKVSPVGFVYKSEFETGELPEDLKMIIRSEEPLVLITHGTSRPYKTEFFSAPIEACRRLGYKAIVVTMHGDLIPDTDCEHIKKYNYLPFATSLPHMKAMVHHGGIGSLNQAMIAGIPQLVLAFEYDRPDNGFRVQQLEIGSWLPPSRWTADDVARDLCSITTPEINENCKRLSARHKNAEKPADRICDMIV